MKLDQKIKDLRKQGLSYREIGLKLRKKLHVINYAVYGREAKRKQREKARVEKKGKKALPTLDSPLSLEALESQYTVVIVRGENPGKALLKAAQEML